MSVRLFEGTAHTQLYARFRPTYPDRVFEEVLNFLKEKIPENRWQIAVDVGCGSGQGTTVLGKYFQKCFGFDVSPAQISEAKDNNRFDNVFYSVSLWNHYLIWLSINYFESKVSPAETLPNIETKSVQLLTAFEAAHWFDLNKFFEEADRVLVDNGVVAFIGYHVPSLDDNNNSDPGLSKLVEEAYFDPRLAPYKNPKIVPIETHYREMRFPKNYEFFHIENIETSYQDTAQNAIGYMESWSLYQGLVNKDRNLAEIYIKEYENKLKTYLKTENLSEREVTINTDYFIAMGRKKGNKSQ